LTDEQIAALQEPGGRRRDEVFSAEERAMLRFTDLLTRVTLGAHLNEDQIVELVLVIATANWTNRVNDGFPAPLS
jgi:alkylhydroperoxidase family enzyme